MLEVRKLMATFTVNDPSAGPSTVGGVTLTDAIVQSNAAGGTNLINFNLAVGANTVTAAASPTSDLPAITSQATIDGTNHNLGVVLSGATATPRNLGLVATANSVLIENITLDGFATSAIVLNGSQGSVTNVVVGRGGPHANLGAGIVVAGANASLTNDLIVGNPTAGVSIGAAATNSALTSNTIGAAAAPNGTGVVLGGQFATLGTNLISNNTGAGVSIGGTASRDTLTGNFIGTDSLGATAAPNGVGVLITGAATGNSIAAGNVISGNTGAGVSINGTAGGNSIFGSTIGLSADGKAAVGNGLGGIFVNASPGNTIGPGNLIAGNTAVGVSIDGKAATLNAVLNNTIGVNALGASLAGATQPDGVDLSGSSSTTTISGNLIAGDSNAGIAAIASTANVIQGNTIGTFNGADLSGTNGILLQAGADFNTIGALAGGAASNTIVFGTAATDFGVAVNGGVKDAILTDDIYALAASTGRGIALTAAGNEGVTAPTIASASNFQFNGAGDVIIGGTLAGEPADGTYTVQLFDNKTAGGVGQGRVFLGTTTAVVTGGNGAFSATVSGQSVGATDSITGTATAGDGSTSEFSTLANAPAIVNPLVVTTPNDGNTPGTLRYAINAANSHAGVADRILFALPDPTAAITVTGSALSPITDPIVIDGTSQAPTARIEVTGATGNAYSGLIFGTNSQGSVVNDLAISDFGAAGVSLAGASGGVTITGTYVGLDRTGAAAGNSIGVVVSSAGNLLGGSVAGSGDVISGNGVGVSISGASASSNLLEGNLIGTGTTGLAAVSNTLAGVVISAGAANNTIGAAGALAATTLGDHNVISGNRGAGVSITGVGSTGNLLLDDYIGVAADGATAMANSAGGVVVESASNAIGSSIAGGGNLISGNSIGGVIVTSAASVSLFGDFIGVDATGAASLPNAVAGVILDASPNATLGAGNVVSGNAGVGVSIFGAAASGASLSGVTIGPDAAGNALPTGAAGQGVGIVVNGAPGAKITGDLISGNAAAGVSIDGAAATGSVISGNTIGTSNVGGSIAGAPQAIGVALSGNSSGASIQGNLIAANSMAGIAAIASTSNTIQGNTIGTFNGADLSGTNGIFLQAGADFNTIGDPAAGGTISNTIVFGTAATSAGVAVTGGAKDAILSNAIYALAASAGRGIALTAAGNEGVTAPTVTQVLDFATNGNGDVIVDGTLAGEPIDGVYTIQIFDNTTAGGVSQGRTLLDTTTATVSGGNGAFSATISGQAIGLGGSITATATANDGSTSEFSTLAGAPKIADALVVNTPIDGLTAGTLRFAIGAANRHSGSLEKLAFELPDPTAAISVTGTALPTIIDPIIIDGGTQAPAGSRIEIHGPPGNAFNGLAFGANSQGSGVNDLAITGFGGAGVSLGAASGPVAITDTSIGLSRSGAAAGNSIGVIVASVGNVLRGDTISANAGDGVALAGSTAGANLVASNVISANGGSGIDLDRSGILNTIGGTSAGSGNTISASGLDGIRLFNTGSTLAGGNLVAGNSISGSGANGIHLVGSLNNTIGGSITGAGNTIGASVINGIELDAGSSSNRVHFNTIGNSSINGLVVSGNANTLSGDTIGGGIGTGSGNIGLVVGGDRNVLSSDVIAGNSLGGVSIGGNANTLGAEVISGNGVFGAAISAGANLLTLSTITANNGVGVTISGNAAGNSITADAITSNSMTGVDLSGAGVTNTLISADTITGSGGYGVAMIGVGSDNTVGGASAAAGNAITGNQFDGVFLGEFSNPTAVGNLIAANSIANNGGDGIALASASNNTIGGTAGSGNTITGNAGNGIVLDVASSANVVALNLMQGNTLSGIVVAGSANSLSGNTVTASASFGILISGDDNSIVGASVSANSLGGVRITGSTNTLAGSTVSGNSSFGVVVSGGDNLATNNLIRNNDGYGVGLFGNAAGNTISASTVSFNTLTGVYLAGSGVADNLASGNIIASNGQYGVALDGVQLSNTIGGSVAAAGNAISANGLDGILLRDAVETSGVGNRIAANSITANLGDGIHLIDSTNNTIGGGAGYGNTIGGSGGNGVELDAASDGNLIGLNLIRSSSLSGLVIAGVSNSLLGNSVAAGAKFGIVVAGDDNSLAGDSITANALGGASIGGNSNTLSGETITANSQYGVVIEGSSNLISGSFVVRNDGQGVGIFQGSRTQLNSLTASTVSFNTLSGVYILGAVETLVASDTIAGNGLYGVALVNDSLSTVGGATAGAGNTVSANGSDGILISESFTNGDDLIAANSITANLGDGIHAFSGFGITIGGAAGFGNSVAGNSGTGIELTSNNSSGFIQGNRVVGNSLDGITIADPSTFIRVSGNTVGGNAGVGVIVAGSFDSFSGDSISGNAKGGVSIEGSNITLTGETIAANSAFGVMLHGGVDRVAGSNISTNGGVGLTIFGTFDANTITGNTIDANSADGVSAFSSTMTHLLFAGNTVSGNAGRGVALSTGVGTTIGGSTSAAGNVISGNRLDGLALEGMASTIGSFLVAANSITANAGGGGNGISVTEAAGVTIGGATGYGNVISGNAGDGIAFDAASSGAIVNDDLISGNRSNGIALAGASNTIGAATTANLANTITSNGADGVSISGSLASGNLVIGNQIGLAGAGNSKSGVHIDDVGGINSIGGPAATFGNTLVGNGGYGVDLQANEPITTRVLVGRGLFDGTGTLDVVPLIPPLIPGTLIENNQIGLVGAGNVLGGVSAVNSPATTITGNTIAANGTTPWLNYDYGVVVFQSDNTLVTSNTLTGNIGDGIIVYHSAGVGVTNSTLSGDPNYGPSGIYLVVAANATITGNAISGYRTYGITGTVSGSAISGNTLGHTTYGGIYLTGGGGNALAKNVVNGSDGNGIELSGSGLNSITANSITGCVGTGLVIAEGDDSVIDGNTLTGGGIGAILSGQHDAMGVNVGNLITANSIGGVVISGDLDVLIHNTIGGTASGAANSGYGVRVASSTTTGVTGNVIAENQIVGNGGIGIVLGNVQATTITGTTITNNGGIGILGSSLNASRISAATITGNGGVGILIGFSYKTLIDNSTISGNAGDGIVSGSSSLCAFVADSIGISGGLAAPNRGNGISLLADTDDRIIGDVISANTGNGIFIQGANGPGMFIQSDDIGTSQGGTAVRDGNKTPLGNQGSGILLLDSPGVVVGGDASPGLGNVIAANQGFGVAIVGALSQGDSLSGNAIGVGAAGPIFASGPNVDPASIDAAESGNGYSGVYIAGAPKTVIGGLSALGRNVISANGRADLFPLADGATTPYFNGIEVHGAALTVIQGNLIGLDADGSAVLGNHDDGIYLDGALLTTIGGSTAPARNVISFNGSVGIEANHGSSGTLIQGNFIGTNAQGLAGTSPRTNKVVGNSLDGVVLGDSSFNTIGGSAPGDGNVISGNGLPTSPHGTKGGGDVGNNDGVGIYIFSKLSGLNSSPTLSGANLIQGNFIGTDATGTGAVSNAFLGVLVTDSSYNTIGGLSTLASAGGSASGLGQGNVISGNQATGVVIYGYNSPNTTGNVIAGNLIGPDVTGTSKLNPLASNSLYGAQDTGILIESASGNTVGGVVPTSGSAPSPRNLISGNSAAGVEIYTPTTGLNATGNPATASANVIAGNLIGTSRVAQARGSGSPLGNGADGIFVSNSTNNTIGGGAAASDSLRNFIAGNEQNGIHIDGPSATGNLIQINTIGLDQFHGSLGNQNYGILISGGAVRDAVNPGVINRNNRFGPIQNTSLKGRGIFGTGSGTTIKSLSARPGFLAVLGRSMKPLRRED